MNTRVDLPSGAKLDITMAPFAISKALYMAMAEELKGLKIESSTELDISFLKDVFLTGLSSKRIDAALADCMKRVTYNGLRIDDQTFEPEVARGDYLLACFEVARANVLPFTKSLLQKYGAILEQVKTSLASGSKTTTS